MNNSQPTKFRSTDNGISFITNHAHFEYPENRRHPNNPLRSDTPRLRRIAITEDQYPEAFLQYRKISARLIEAVKATDPHQSTTLPRPSVTGLIGSMITLVLLHPYPTVQCEHQYEAAPTAYVLTPRAALVARKLENIVTDLRIETYTGYV